MTIRTLAGAACATLLTASLAGCIGQDTEEPVQGSGDEVLSGAAEALEETSGVHLRITSSGMDAQTTGLVEAEGDAVKPASFEGSGVAQVMGLTADFDLVAIGGTTWVKSAVLGPRWRTFDLSEYGVPDPARLLGDEGGIADLLLETEDVERDKDVRCGDGNDDVCTELTGTLSGGLVRSIVPSATGDSFDVAYLVGSDGRLQSAELTGVFYQGTESMSYTITIDEYGVDKKITDPS